MRRLLTIYILFFSLSSAVLSQKNCEQINVSQYSDSITQLLNSKLTNIVNAAKKQKYPSFYGGAYIDNGSIVLLVADTVFCNKVLDLAKDTAFLKIKPCLYSYKSLLDVYEKLDAFFYKMSNRVIVEKKIGWSSFYLSIPDNRIYIRLNNCNKANIDHFKKNVLDSPILIFVKADPYIHI